MHFLGLLLLTVAKVLRLIINLYTFIVAGAAIVSWLNPDPYNPIIRFLYQATQPVFQKIRRYLPRSFFRLGFDPTPILVVVLLMAIDTILLGLLFEWSNQLLILVKK